jgi:hypothetical protein
MAQLTLQIDDELFRSVTALATARGIDVHALLLRVLNAMAREPWKKDPIGPLTRQLSGLVADDKLTDREQIERAIVEKHG